MNEISEIESDRAGGEVPGWEHFPHDADIGIRGRGATPAEAFEQAALAATAVLTEPDRIQASIRIDVMVEAPDIEILLVKWLNAIVYEMATRSMVFGRFRVRIDDRSLKGEAWGEPVEVARHEPAVEIKGATLTELRVTQESDRSWLAQCVLDV